MKTDHEVKVLQHLLKFPVTLSILIPATLIVLLSAQIPPPFPAVLSLKLLPPVMVRVLYHSLIAPPLPCVELFRLKVTFSVRIRILSIA